MDLVPCESQGKVGTLQADTSQTSTMSSRRETAQCSVSWLFGSKASTDDAGSLQALSIACAYHVQPYRNLPLDLRNARRNNLLQQNLYTAMDLADMATEQVPSLILKNQTLTLACIVLIGARTPPSAQMNSVRQARTWTIRGSLVFPCWKR